MNLKQVATLSALLTCGGLFAPAPLRVLLAEAWAVVGSGFHGNQDGEERLFGIENPAIDTAMGRFTGNERAFMNRALGRSVRFLPEIRRILAEEGLPADLGFLVLIESGFNQSAVSRASAVGLWQFMADTGRGYGLAVNGEVDERHDLFRSTRAAARFLKDLYAQFGDWYLALAAYNSGAGYISRRIRETGLTDYWQLIEKGALYRETTEYVPRFLAARRIARAPEHYGFTTIPFEYGSRLAQARIPGGTSLAAVAMTHGIALEELRRLNPHLRSGRTPVAGGGYEINLPATMAPRVSLIGETLTRFGDSG
jgi:membrane-bound lytic murein transglycosylase D